MLHHCSIQALSAEATTVGTGFHFGSKFSASAKAELSTFAASLCGSVRTVLACAHATSPTRTCMIASRSVPDQKPRVLPFQLISSYNVHKHQSRGFGKLAGANLKP